MINLKLKRKTTGLVVFLILTLSLVHISQTSNIKTPLSRVEKITSSKTSLGTDVFAESLELFAGRQSSLIGQLNYVGGNYEFPFDLSAPEFEHLDAYVLYSGDQRKISEYWPRTLAELRDGISLILSFDSINYPTAIGYAETIRDAVNLEYSLNLKPLFGHNEGDMSTIAYYQALKDSELNTFLANGWKGSPYDDGFDSLSSATALQNAPAKITANILKRVEDPQFPSGWMPVNVAAYVKENAIKIDENDIHNLSLSEVFDLTSIHGSANSNYSLIKLRMPYVANVYSVDPLTDNLYPEITGDYQWTIRTSFTEANWFENNTYDDIVLEYDLNMTDFTNFPQIEATQTIDIDALTNDNILNYTISMTNTGNETASNVKFVQELGDPPESFTTPIFNNETYFFNDTLIVYFDTDSGVMMDTTPPYEDLLNITYDGWFQYKANNSIVQPIVYEPDNSTAPYNHTNINYEIKFDETWQMLHVNRTFFTFNFSDTFTPVDDISYGTAPQPNYGLEGNIASLEVGHTQKMWWSIGNLPSENDFFNNINFTATASDPDSKGYDDTYVVDFMYWGTISLKDFVLQEAIKKGQDLRFPPGISELGWLGGSKFRYEDQVGREYFGLSNGLGFQLYDDEAILVTTVNTDKSIYRIGDDININFTIENIGDSPASDVKLTGYHAYMKPNWELGDIIEFYNATKVSTINPGETVNITWQGKANTFLGIHPVFAGVTYTTESGQTAGWNGTYTWNNVLSTLVNVVVLPPEYKAGKEEPSFPTPEIRVNVSLLTDGEVTVGDVLEVHTTIKNVGDEDTHITVISYFGNDNLDLVLDAYAEVGTVKITYENGTFLDYYNQAHVVDSDLGVTYVGASDIALKPNETIHIYYKVNTTTPGTFTLPPIVVEYDSDYPMDIPAGEESTKPEDNSETFPLQPVLKYANNQIKTLKTGYTQKRDPMGIRSKPTPVFSSVNSWSSASNPTDEDVKEEEKIASSSEELPSSTDGLGGEDTSQIGIPGFDIFMATLAIISIPCIRLLRKRKH